MTKRSFLPIFLTVLLCHQPIGHCLGITALLSAFFAHPVASTAVLGMIGGLAGTGTGHMCVKNRGSFTKEEITRVRQHQLFGLATGAIAGGSIYLWRTYGK